MARVSIPLALLLALLGVASAGAQDQKSEKQPDQADPKMIWQASLEKIAGTYQFLQVASPGGLWETDMGKNTPRQSRQVSINELPAAFRDKLRKAELTISDLKLPSTVEASEKTSPSGRGKLRYYQESATGKLTLHNLPGIGLDSDDKGEYTGPVTFDLLHQSHSNPSPFGIYQQRLQQEATWGASTLDFADLTATPPTTKPDDEGHPVIANARVMRSSFEIFAYVEWTVHEKDLDRHFTGSVRLMRKTEDAPQIRPPMRPRVATL